MSPELMILPKFNKNDIVHFAGGVGKIKTCQFDSSTWVYTVEMEMGVEPDFGRVGSETTILLYEADIQG